MANVKSFRTPVMSSWKYASPKGTFMYLYFPNGEVNAVLVIDDSSNGMLEHPACRSNVKKYFAPLIGGNILYFWHGPNKFPCHLIECAVVNNYMFSSITFGDNYDGC